MSEAEYKENLKKIYTVHSIEEFWSVYHHIPHVDELPTHFSYHFMRYDWRPVWEDDATRDGGIWRIRIPSNRSVSILLLCFAIILLLLLLLVAILFCYLSFIFSWTWNIFFVMTVRKNSLLALDNWYGQLLPVWLDVIQIVWGKESFDQVNYIEETWFYYIALINFIMLEMV